MRGGRNAGLNTQLGFSFSFGTPPRHLSEGKKDYFIPGHHFIPTGLQLFLFFFSFVFYFFLLQLLQDFSLSPFFSLPQLDLGISNKPKWRLNESPTQIQTS